MFDITEMSAYPFVRINRIKVPFTAVREYHDAVGAWQNAFLDLFNCEQDRS
jgi:hypothetical protein